MVVEVKKIVGTLVNHPPQKKNNKTKGGWFWIHTRSQKEEKSHAFGGFILDTMMYIYAWERGKAFGVPKS